MFTQRPIHQHGWKLPKACYIVYFNHRFLKENYLACVSEASSMSIKSKKFIQWAKWWHKHVLCIFMYHWSRWRDKSNPMVGWKGSTVNTATNIPTNYHHQQIDFLKIFMYIGWYQKSKERGQSEREKLSPPTPSTHIQGTIYHPLTAEFLK